MIVKTGREKQQEVNIEVGKGRIERTEKYRYLGNMIATKGGVAGQLEEIKRKLVGIVGEVKNIGERRKVGRMDCSVRLMLWERVVVPTMLFNLETWTYWRESDWEELEKMQGSGLRELLQVPRITPYWGLLIETGMWPMKQRVECRKLMWLKEIMEKDEESVVRKLIVEQKELEIENGWYAEMKKLGHEYGIEVEGVDEMTKSGWKRMVKR